MILASRHARKRERQEHLRGKWEAEATKHNELHSLFFGVPHVPMREVRKNLDAKLTTYQTKSILDEPDDDEEKEE